MHVKLKYCCHTTLLTQAERYANHVGLLRALEFEEREKEMPDANAYFQLAMGRYKMMLEYLKDHPEVKIPDLRHTVANEDVMQYNVFARASRKQKQT